MKHMPVSEESKAPAALGQLDAKARKAGFLRALRTRLQAFVRLLRAYANGSYRGIPWYSMLLLAACTLYLLSPMDLVPDIILGFGFLDDAALLAWTARKWASWIDDFMIWEATARRS